MFHFIRNVHLALGLTIVAMALIFALSSLVIIHRPWFPESSEESARTVRVPLQEASTPRTLARALMRGEGLKGTLGVIEEDPETVRLRIFRPGTEFRIEYERSTSEAKIEVRRWGVLETLVQLHVNHGFWHDFAPTNAWAAFSLLASIGLLLLGASGIYLWFEHHEERVVGGVLLILGLTYGLVTLALTRTQTT